MELRDAEVAAGRKKKCGAKDPLHCPYHGVIGKIGTAQSLGLEKLKDIVPEKASKESNTRRSRNALNKGFIAHSIDDHDVIFSKEVLTHWQTAEVYKPEEEEERRLRRLSDAVRAVKKPHEIWEDHNGQRTYIRVFKAPDGRFVMSGFITGHNNTVRSFFHSRRLNGAEKMRKGKLIYKR